MDKVETAMSTEALNRIIKEVNALTPQERLELIERLTHEEQNDDSALSSLSTDNKEITTVAATLRDWLNKARNMRAKLPPTSDSVDIVRELREVRFRQ